MSAPAPGFVLGVPRSGTTLLRVMLEGHTKLFSPPEMILAPFETMAQRKTSLEERFWEKGGLRRALMELEGLDVDGAKAAEAALERIKSGRPPAVDDLEKAGNITLGTLDQDLGLIRDYDWICEAVIEDLAAKRALFERLEPLRRDGSVVSTNTSGIPLRDIIEGMPDRLRRDIAVTHFFNPVKIMRLMELVPGSDTTPDVIRTLTDFCGTTLGKGVVHAKDTVNFIGNRIGCFWMLMGLHKADLALRDGIEKRPR